MRNIRIALGLALGFLVGVIPVAAQSSGDTAKFEVSLDYAYVRARTVVVAGCCFNMNGGEISLAYNANNWFSLVGDFGLYYAGNVQNSGLTLTVFPYTFGPRVSIRKNKTFTPYVEGLFGGGYAGGTIYTRAFAPTGGKSAFALSAGGGLDAKLSKHFALQLVQCDYFFTNFPDGASNHEHNFRLTTGIIFRFGSH
ncbi:MAG: outer membrane beta-barrel protein [Candidatus Acidiferrales bacterium]